MPHDLEREYGLSADELLDAINRRFRAKVTLEGAVAEVHLGKLIKALRKRGVIHRYESHDLDGHPDYSIWIKATSKRPIYVECKNVRDSDEAYREKGVIVAYKVETQKTRASKGDKSSRFYDRNYFQILAVCLGKKTHNWKSFHFTATKTLARHAKYPNKLAVMHRVPLPTSPVVPPWYNDLARMLQAWQST